jgi:hypothetical protein
MLRQLSSAVPYTPQWRGFSRSPFRVIFDSTARQWLKPLPMFYHIEILLFRDGDDQKPEIFPLFDEDDQAADATPPAYLPDSGDFIVIDGVHAGKVTWRTFAYDRDNDFCHVMINADRVTRPPRVVVANDRR